MRCIVLAVQLNRINADVNEHFHAVFTGQTNSMTHQRFHSGIKRCIYLAFARLNCRALAKNLCGKCVIVSIRQADCLALHRRQNILLALCFLRFCECRCCFRCTVCRLRCVLVAKHPRQCKSYACGDRKHQNVLDRCIEAQLHVRTHLFYKLFLELRLPLFSEPRTSSW